MHLKLEPEIFEKHQEIFVKEVVETIMVKLIEGGVKGEKLEELTANIAFSIASIIDDTTAIQSGGIEVNPYLTFRTDDDETVHCGENSYTYEYVIGTLKDLFDV